MRIHVIACEVLFRELCMAAAQAGPIVDLTFVRKGLHDEPELLRRTLQELVDRAAEDGRADYIALCYGLCSNGTAGLRAPNMPLVIPRAHDCITLFLGSRQRYDEMFRQRPGTYYYTSGWLERGGDAPPPGAEEGKRLALGSFEELVRKYGEENARYLMEVQGAWKQRYTTACYIRMPLSHRDEYAQQVRKIAEENGWEYLEVEGDDRLIRALVEGQWDEAEFQIIEPGHELGCSYDERIFCCRTCRAGR